MRLATKVAALFSIQYSKIFDKNFDLDWFALNSSNSSNWESISWTRKRLLSVVVIGLKQIQYKSVQQIYINALMEIIFQNPTLIQ